MVLKINSDRFPIQRQLVVLSNGTNVFSVTYDVNVYILVEYISVFKGLNELSNTIN